MQNKLSHKSEHGKKKSSKGKIRSSKQPKHDKAHKKSSPIPKKKKQTLYKTQSAQSYKINKKNKCREQQQDEVQGLLGKLKIKNKVHEAEKKISENAILQSKLKSKAQASTLPAGKPSCRLSTVEEMPRSTGHNRGRGGLLQGW